LLRRVCEARIVLGDPAQASDLVAHLVQPPLDDRLERIRPVGRGFQAFDEASVDGLEMMQRRVVDRDLNFGGRELPLTGPGAEVTRGERLAGSVLPSNPLREPFATGDEVELFVHRGDERIETRREVLEALIRHEPASKGVHDRR
jgi:hypothetical protein